MDQRLVPSLKTLRDEIDHLAPRRDRGADGDIGDRAHQREVSAHNPDDTPGVRVPREDADHTPEIHALDIDASGPWPAGKDLNWIVEVIRGRHLRGFDTRLQNIIWRGRIASRSWGWTWEDRAGIGHYDHAHFEATSVSASEADTRPWGILLSTPDITTKEDDNMALTDRLTLTPWAKQQIGGSYADDTDMSLTTAFNLLLGFSAQASRNAPTDTKAIVAGVLAGLEPDEIAEAVPADIAKEVADLLSARLAS